KEVSPTRDGKPATLEFMEEFYWVQRTQGDGTFYRLLVRKDPKSRKITDYVGWVDERYLVTRLEAQKDEDTHIHRQGLIVTRPRGARGKRSSGTPPRPAPTPARDAPGRPRCTPNPSKRTAPGTRRTERSGSSSRRNWMGLLAPCRPTRSASCSCPGPRTPRKS